MTEETRQEVTRSVDRPIDWEVIARALARMVEEDYPGHRTLAEIAYVWGDATQDEIREIEGSRLLK